MSSATNKKILLLLFKGLEFGYSYTFRNQWKVLDSLSKEWEKIDERELKNKINQLYRSRAIKRKENPDGSVSIFLTEKGKVKALNYVFEDIKIKKSKWDGMWRIVTFDIPEKKRAGRDALREKIKQAGFYELQKSVWICPYDCKNEVDFIVEFFDLRKYVRFCILSFIDNELHLKKIFKLK